MARVSRLVLGARNARLGRRPYGDYTLERLLGMVERPPEVVEGIRIAECEELRRAWEAERRAAGG